MRPGQSPVGKQAAASRASQVMIDHRAQVNGIFVFGLLPVGVGVDN